MAVGLSGLPEMYSVRGIRLGATAAAIRKKDRRDLVVVECAPGTVVAGVFTQNRFCAAPVSIAKSHLAAAVPRALLINTGFANAGTGAPGEADANACCQALGELLDIPANQVLPFSTGVIGERLPVDRLTAGLPAATAALHESGWVDAAHGIMTTDTLPKGSSRRFKLGATQVTVTGIAKGAGMICPNMATMLAFIATDAAVSKVALDACLATAVQTTFNRISVDGDTSTNDACILLASGTAGNPLIDNKAGSDYAILLANITEVFAELAQAIIRDAEGATKFITIDVTQGASEADCLEVAQVIAHSPLVKTAFFASDPNWGRILAAVGRARLSRLDVATVNIYLDDVQIVKNGARAPDYTEAQGQAVMAKAEIRLRVELGSGRASTRLWTCDLSHDYVRINAEYRS
jgi:glutamate N-acetyltransferase / amino-acid N-acetyltransferase